MADEWSIDELFDDDYLFFYAPFLTEEASDAEAALVHDLLALQPGAEVLDLACGHGRIANRLAAAGARVTGLDATERSIEPCGLAGGSSSSSTTRTVSSRTGFRRRWCVWTTRS